MNSEAVVAGVPKADLHVHQERSPRLDRILAARRQEPALDWAAWMKRMTAETPPGVERLRRMQTHFPAPLAADDDPEVFVARVADLLAEAGAAGALLVEPRFGNETVLRDDFFALVRAAVERVQENHPALSVAPIVAFKLGNPASEIERLLARCARGARENALAGIDLLCEPYDAEADWRTAYRVARVAIDEGLGVTAHAGEFSTANLAAALAVPGLTRIGHATQAVRDDRLFERLATTGVTVECCLTSNVALGAVAHLEEHPLPRLIAEGIPVALGTDDPVELGTTIDREYALAASLGLGLAQLTELTRTAICASFTSPEHRSELLVQLYASIGAEAARGPEDTA